jgi:hypothetical protein
MKFLLGKISKNLDTSMIVSEDETMKEGNSLISSSMHKIILTSKISSLLLLMKQKVLVLNLKRDSNKILISATRMQMQILSSRIYAITMVMVFCQSNTVIIQEEDNIETLGNKNIKRLNEGFHPTGVKNGNKIDLPLRKNKRCLMAKIKVM